MVLENDMKYISICMLSNKCSAQAANLDSCDGYITLVLNGEKSKDNVRYLIVLQVQQLHVEFGWRKYASVN